MVQAVPRPESPESSPARIDPGLWRRLGPSASRETFCDAWLHIQVELIPGISRALVLDLEEQGEEYAVAAAWPDPDSPGSDLVEAGGEAIDDRQPLVLGGTQSGPGADGTVVLAYPLTVDEVCRSVAVFELRGATEGTLRDAMTRLQWGSAWLEVLHLRDRAKADELTLDRLRTVMDLVAVTLEQGRYDAAVSAMVTELAARLGCDRVSYGEYRGRRSRVRALSHSGQFGRQMNLIGAIGRAMDEAIDQRTTLVHPRGAAAEATVTRMQAELVERHGSASVITVPLILANRPLGALCFEFPGSSVPDQSLVELCDAIGMLFAPLVHDKRALGRNILVKNAAALKSLGGRLLGPRHLALKIAVLAIAAGGTWLSTATGAYKVTADAVLEGAVQRVVAAPFDGYVAASFRRAGDRVEAGETLGELDDRDYRLELIQLASERAQAAGQYREAQAAHERARTKIFQARIEQADARIALVEEQIERTRLKAPFDGIVVSGDLSQSLGAAVERGEVLFEVAPLDDYRIILEVDERDVDYVEVGQPVSLVLSALASERIETTVNKVTPVSVPSEGRNYFRVEAHYRAENTRLRPGMEGVAKIAIDERPLLWIWTREMVDWVRLAVWRWAS